ncbi:MAG: hypothetical protein ACI85U_000877 [Candidatus Promineifilaceae bacterium]|jgi:hypothetical protein
MQKLKHNFSILVVYGFFLFLMVILTACGGGQAPDAVPEAVIEEPAQAPVESVAEEEMSEEAADEPVSASSSEDEDGSPFVPGSNAKSDPTRALAEIALADAEVRITDGESDEVYPEPPADSLLTAGEIDDNENWDDYLLYIRQYDGAEIIWIDVVERHILTILDGNGRPVQGEEVELLENGQVVHTLRTHSDGSILIFPATFDLPAGTLNLEARLVKTGDSVVIELGATQRSWELVAQSYTVQEQVKLDIHFLIDTTGSMADEINQLRDNMVTISQQIDALPAAPDVRYGMTLYRDRGDAYHVLTSDFKPDVNAFVKELNEVEADGGGDYPEDVTEGLFRALNEPEWRVENTVSLIFLIADAPPHLDYGDDEFNYAVHTQQAAALGVKIYSIASSGLDQQGEYIFRQMAQVTGGRFIFLTYGADGAGTTGEQTDMTVDPDDFTVDELDNLIVKIVEEELSH